MAMGEVVLFQAQQVPAQLGALPPPMLAFVVIHPDKQAYRGAQNINPTSVTPT